MAAKRARSCAWNAGSSHTLTYSIGNPNALFANDYNYTLTAGRDWPGFPITGSARYTIDMPPSPIVPVIR